MTARKMTAPALALATMLAVGGYATAGDPPAKSGIGGGFGGTTMTLGGTGTAAQAAAADDTELAGCHRKYGYGYGYSSYYGGGFGYSSYYTTYYRGHCGYRPAYYGGYYGGGFGYPAYYYPRPIPYSMYGGYGGFYGRISGTEDDTSAPVVSLALTVAKNPTVTFASAPVRSAPASQPAGGFRYDGGPANPVPQPTPDATPKAPTAPPVAGLPVSLPKTAKPANPYTYKAYGEK